MLEFLVFTILTVVCFLVKGWGQDLCVFVYLFVIFWAMLRSLEPFHGGKVGRVTSDRSYEYRRWMESANTVGPTPTRQKRYNAVSCALLILPAVGSMFFVRTRLLPAWLIFGGYYLSSVISFCLYHPVEFWLIRLRSYKKLQKACAKKSYRLSGDLREFLTSDAKNDKTRTLPRLCIETPEEILSIRVLGRPGVPLRYVFEELPWEGEGKKTAVRYTVLLMDPVRDQLGDLRDISPLRPSDARIWSGWMRRRKPQLYTLPAPEAEAFGRAGKKKPCENILLFCPDGALCEDRGAQKTVAVGGDLHGYTVYNTDRFVRGRLGSRGE